MTNRESLDGKLKINEKNTAETTADRRYQDTAEARRIKKPELLAPGGNPEKLKTAFHYGADAVYIGGARFGLRANAGNFTPQEIAEAVQLADRLGKKLYVTMNAFARSSDLREIGDFAGLLRNLGVHAVITADLGVHAAVREAAPELPVHISTQANNLNWRTCAVWQQLGAQRVNLARELSLAEIREIREALDRSGCPELELEAFVHGAMCMAYSGRCMLSDYLAGRSSNKGDCAQPCRWKYYVTEQQRPGVYIPISEEEQGTFLFNSKDLCMIGHLPEMIEAGVSALKIEGRMKSEFYTAVTVRAYRLALDRFWDAYTRRLRCADGAAEAFAAAAEEYREDRTLQHMLLAELCSVSHRAYDTGFYFHGRGSQIYDTASYQRDCDFAGVVAQCDACGNGMHRLVLIQRGVFQIGDLLEFVTAGEQIYRYIPDEMRDQEGVRIVRAPHPLMPVHLQVPFSVAPGTIVRRRRHTAADGF